MTTGQGELQAGSDWRRPQRLESIIRLVAAEILIVAAWVAVTTWSSLPEGALRRDWTALYRAGDLWWGGQLAVIYSGAIDAPYKFLFPPYAIYLFALFALVPFRLAHLALVVASFAALTGAFLALRSALPERTGKYFTILLVTFSSTPWLTSLVIGQLSPLYLFLMAAGLAAYSAGWPAMAGAIWALLMIKPNIALPLFACACVARQWRLVQSWSGIFALMALTTLPMGIDAWQQAEISAVKMAGMIRRSPEAIWKHATLYAFFQTTLHPVVSQTTVDALSVAASIALLLLLLDVWRRGAHSGRIARLVGATVLYVIAGNVYLWFYDCLLLVIPATAWFLTPESYASRTRYKTIGLLLAAIFVWQHLSLFWIQGGPALTGGFVAAWLVIELVDLRRGSSGVEAIAGSNQR